jgi:hypothetical protein
MAFETPQLEDWKHVLLETDGILRRRAERPDTPREQD